MSSPNVEVYGGTQTDKVQFCTGFGVGNPLSFPTDSRNLLFIGGWSDL